MLQWYRNIKKLWASEAGNVRDYDMKEVRWNVVRDFAAIPAAGDYTPKNLASRLHVAAGIKISITTANSPQPLQILCAYSSLVLCVVTLGSHIFPGFLQLVYI